MIKQTKLIGRAAFLLMTIFSTATTAHANDANLPDLKVDNMRFSQYGNNKGYFTHVSFFIKNSGAAKAKSYSYDITLTGGVFLIRANLRHEAPVTP